MTWPTGLDNLQTRQAGEEWLAADYLSMLAGAARVFGILFIQLADDARLPAVVHCLPGNGGRAAADRLGGRPRYRARRLRADQPLPGLSGARGGRSIRPAWHQPPRSAGTDERTPVDDGRARGELDDSYGGIDEYLLGPGCMSVQPLSALRANRIG